ncbi:MAG: hypothetical protein RSP_08390 [Rhodanobacter sp.]
MTLRFSQIVACAALALATSAAFAATPQAASPAGHSTKLGQCSHANAGKKGAEYKSAVAACMKGESAAPAAKKTPQQKMAACSKANAGKKGAEYKSAVSACMKGGA